MLNPGHLYDEEMDDEWNEDGPFNPVYDALMNSGESSLDEFEEDEMDDFGDEYDVDDFGDDYDMDDEMFGGRRSRYARLATRYLRSTQRGKDRRSARLMSRMEKLWDKMRPMKKAGLDSPDTVEAKASGATASITQSAPVATAAPMRRPRRNVRRRGNRGRGRSVFRPGGLHPAHRGQAQASSQWQRPQRTDPRYFADQQAMEHQLAQSMPAYMGDVLDIDIDEELAGADADLELLMSMEEMGRHPRQRRHGSRDSHLDEMDDFGDDYGGDDLEEDDEMGILGLGRRERYARLSTRYAKLSMRGKTRRMARVMSRMQRIWGKMKPRKKAGLDSPGSVMKKAGRAVASTEGKLVDYVTPRGGGLRNPMLHAGRMQRGVSWKSYGGHGKTKHMKKQAMKRRAKIRASRN